MKSLYKVVGGKKYAIQEAVDEFFDEELPTIREKLDPKQATESSLSTMGFKLITNRPQILDGRDPYTDEHIPIILVAIAKLDDKYYGAYYNPAYNTKAAEELILDRNKNVVSSIVIENQQEWLVVCNWFNLNNVYEKAGLMNWYLAYRVGKAKKLTEHIAKAEWYKKASSFRKQHHLKELTPMHVLQQIPKVSRLTSLHQTPAGFFSDGLRGKRLEYWMKRYIKLA